MIIVNAQLPALAPWLAATFAVEAVAVRDLGLRDAEDQVIFDAARQRQAIVMSKDADFVRLLEHHGPPPRIIWITCGNTSNAALQRVLAAMLPTALQMLESGDSLVEIGPLV